jgi:adenosylmethionine-8-amino-7-oxononanoate aminotransferase
MTIHRIPVPDGTNTEAILNQIKTIIDSDLIAGFVYEPLVQGAAGMKIHDSDSLNEILNCFKSNGILTIADEVMTGFGKTGRYFASDHIRTKPDIICLSKSLTAGLVPMAITSCTETIYEAFLGESITKGFMHCHTYSANPIACAAAIAGIELLQSDTIQTNITRIANAHKAFESRIQNHSKVKSARSIGVILAIDLNTTAQRYGDLRDKLLAFFMKNGVFLRPLGNTIYIQPPYIISKDELHSVYKIIEESLEIV